MAQEVIASQDRIKFFESKIRPLLIEHCVDCHAVDSDASGGLLLDSRDGWQVGGASGNSIIPGDPESSLAFQAISYSNPDLQMPPDGKLSQEEINAFRDWISDGAFDPRRGTATLNSQSGLPVERAHEHWAYRKFQRPQVPSSSNAANPIDAFIDSRLREEGFQAAPLSKPESLIRRLHFDLTGLPPSPELIHEIQHSSREQFDEIYSQTVERLLASPRFGEKFARNWMDVVRYADSITLRGFVLPNAWRYRDYLIDAFSQDRSFATMIHEQLAGDLLAAKTHDVSEKRKQLVATGFLVLGNTNLEQQDKTQLEMDYIDEQLEVMGRAFLAQTIGCARCHDHKFDPIPTQDYYALAGILRSSVALKHDNVSKWIDKELPLDAKDQSYFTALKIVKGSIESNLQEHEQSLSQVALKPRIAPEELEGVVVDSSNAELIGNWRKSTWATPIVGEHYLVAGESGSDNSTATFAPKDLSPGTYEVRIAYTAYSNRAQNASVSVFGAEGEKSFRVDQRNKGDNYPWFSLGKHRFEEDGQAYVLVSASKANGVVIADAVQFLPVDDENQALTSSSDDKKLFGAPPTSVKELEKISKQIDKIFANKPQVITLFEGRDTQDIPIHIRGDVHNLGAVVPRGFLSAIPTETSSPNAFSAREVTTDRNAPAPNRQDLARWMTQKQNPLTSRVYANRVWSWLMGQGLVPSINNFGTTGQAPSHPELLNWLAAELSDNDWSTKHVVRLIVHSNAYRRKADFASKTAMQLDPENTYYWRGQVRRLTPEEIRDAMLLSSGELDTIMKGSLIRKGTKADYNYNHETTRRSIYHPVFRNSLPPLFAAFDFADTSVSIGDRPRSTVATQALALNNHPWVRSRAEAAASRLLKKYNITNNSLNGADALVRELYQTCLGRSADDDELQFALDFLETQENAQDSLTIFIHAIYGSLDFRFLD